MSEYLGMFELQPLYDGRKSFHGKAFVERWNDENGMRYVLKSYGTTVATVEAVSARDVDHEMFDVRIGMEYLTATTLRHVKEFLAQIDGTFKGVSLGWIRKAIKDGQTIDGDTVGPECRRTYVLKTL